LNFTESCVGEIGITPSIETFPIVVLSPTSEAMLEGAIMESSVSVPRATRPKLAAIATAEPVLDSLGSEMRT